MKKSLLLLVSFILFSCSGEIDIDDYNKSIIGEWVAYDGAFLGVEYGEIGFDFKRDTYQYYHYSKATDGHPSALISPPIRDIPYQVLNDTIYFWTDAISIIDEFGHLELEAKYNPEWIILKLTKKELIVKLLTLYIEGDPDANVLQLKRR